MTSRAGRRSRRASSDARRGLVLASLSAVALLALFVPAWAGLAGLAWSDTYDAELTVMAFVGMLLFFASAVGYVALILLPDVSRKTKPKRGHGLSVREHVIPSLLLATILLGGVTGAAEFVVAMASGTSADAYRLWIVSAMYGGSLLTMLSVVLFQRPRWLAPEPLLKVRDERERRRRPS